MMSHLNRYRHSFNSNRNLILSEHVVFVLCLFQRKLFTYLTRRDKMLGEMLQRRAKTRPLNVGQDCNEEDGEEQTNLITNFIIIIYLCSPLQQAT